MSRIATPADQMAFDDAFWKAQPFPVQKLRDEQDFEKRKMMATVLTDFNYRIHVPIMVWGWDPFNVMSLAAGFGYTWLPAMGETPVQIAPGLANTFVDLKPYDPKTPSPRAFKVSLDFDDYPPATA